MPEIDEEQTSEPFDLQRYVDVAKRRYGYFLGALFFGWFVVWGLSWVLPAKYKSGTLILVEEPTMPKDYVTPNISDDLQQRLQNITQQILSRTRLLHIIDQMNLYAGKQVDMTPDEKVASMRKDIDIELVRDPSSVITAFNIYYSSRDPHVAQQVTRELTNLFINENNEVRQQQSEDTTRFLAGQLDTARQNLAQQDAKIEQFKGAHQGALPSQQATNVQILAGLQSQLENEEGALNAAQQQRVYLQTLVNQSRTSPAVSRTVDGAPAGLAGIDAELDKLRSQLAVLSTQYTDQYPDIRTLKVQIARTEKRRDDLVANLKKDANSGKAAGGSAAAQDTMDPAQSSALLQLRGQLQANQAEVTNRQRAVGDLKAKIDEYQARLNEEPGSEQQLADLTRGYEQSQANYDDLLKKETESQMATSMEQMQQGQRFRMLDPPNLPLKPDFPNRLKFSAMALAFGLIFGVAVVGGLEFMDDRLHSEKELKELLPTKVITEIPEVVNSTDERKSRRRMLFSWAMSLLVFTGILAGSAISYLHS